MQHPIQNTAAIRSAKNSTDRPASPNHPLLGLLLSTVSVLMVLSSASTAFATNSGWDFDPGSGDWNDPANWTPAVPNGPEDTAIFGISNTTAVSISTNTEVDGITFDPGASAYTITASAGSSLTLSGVGITNNSGIPLNLVTTVGDFGDFVTVVFSNSATAGSNVYILNQRGCSINFFDNSTAGGANIDNFEVNDFGSINFFNSSTAGNSSISNDSEVNFFDNSTLGSAYNQDKGAATSFYNDSTAGNGSIETFEGSGISFYDNSTAGSAAFIGVEQVSSLQFLDNSSAGSAFIGMEGFVELGDSSNAGSATFTGSGYLSFSGSAQGGTARINLFYNPSTFSIGTLDISGHNAPGVTIGSIEGDEDVFLGANNLTVGSNNLSNTFSGLMQDGGANGSFTKIGTGTLTLSGANTYTGGTTVAQGTLVVVSQKASATGSGPIMVDEGTLEGNGKLSGAITVGTGNGAGGFLAPGVDGLGSLRTKSSVTFNSDSTFNCELSPNKQRSDQVAAKGVTINGGAVFSFISIGSKAIPTGTVFTVIENTSRRLTVGTFSNLADGSTFTVGRNTFKANYKGGTGNDLTLTVQ
jgi:autotransporter-associated beta strand protein